MIASLLRVRAQKAVKKLSPKLKLTSFDNNQSTDIMDTSTALSNADSGEPGNDEANEIDTTLKLSDIIISDSEEDDEVDFDEDYDEELPPVLEPPSTGYLHTVDLNQGPPTLLTVNELGIIRKGRCIGDVEKQEKLPTPEVIDVRDSDDEGSTTTDSDDDRVDVDYLRNTPKGLKNLLSKYDFLNSRETWVYNVRNLYKRQPTRIRRLLKIHKDVDGNPVEQPAEMLFEKIHAERERMRRSQNIKREVEENSNEAFPVTIKLNISSSDSRLVHVAYPGNVVNNDKAIETLGGIGTLSKAFDQMNKKLLLKFRPNDPFANGVNGQLRNSCGLLLRVRRRKGARGTSNNSSTHQQENSTCGSSATRSDRKINLDELGDDPVSTEIIHDMLFDQHLLVQYREKKSDHSVTINDTKYVEQDLLDEDKLITSEKTKKDKYKKTEQGLGRAKDFNLKLPKIVESIPDTNLKVDTVGIIHRSYDFNGICDFQYLPITKKANGSMTSIKDKILPIFGDTDNPEKLVMKELISEETRCQTFSLPPAMSRIDNPPRGLIDELIVSEKTDSATRKLPPDDSIYSNRMKRIIYTIAYNFQPGANNPDSELGVPTQPLSLAITDIERRQIKKDLIDNVRSKFDERPVWSKAALEFASRIPTQTLKYIIPHFAYFSANGPWRNTWIKFGVDPRRNAGYVIYQSVDFRVPFIYRRFLNMTTNHPEANHKFLPEQVPPKTQMFYQLCDIKLDEIKELIETLLKKAKAGELVYEERFGFLKEGSYEYFRYILTFYLENLFQEHGKLPASSNAEISFTIPPGEIEPMDKLKAAPHRRMKVKRIRRSTKKLVDPSIAAAATKRNSKGKSKKKADVPVKREGSQYGKTLEDLALNDLPSGSDEYYDEDDEDDYDYLDE